MAFTESFCSYFIQFQNEITEEGDRTVYEAERLISKRGRKTNLGCYWTAKQNRYPIFEEISLG